MGGRTGSSGRRVGSGPPGQPKNSTGNPRNRFRVSPMPDPSAKTDLFNFEQIMPLRRTYTHMQATRACASRRPAGLASQWT